MQESKDKIDIVLIADRPGRATLLQEVMRDNGVSGTIRRLTPGDRAIQRIRQTGEFRRVAMPDLFFFDFSNADRHNISVLRDIDGGAAVMLTPTSLSTCAARMQTGNRKAYFKALHIFYEFGPILVRMPEQVLAQEALEDVIPA